MSDANNLGPGWKSWEKTAQHGPGQLVIRLVIFFMLLGGAVGAVGYFAGWFVESAQLAKVEFGPKAALEKYERLKEMAAQLTARKSSIALMEQDLEQRRSDNGGKSKGEWPRDERAAFNQKENELAGLKMSFNNLAADYNAAMAKFNWSFAKQGELPAGANEVLPGDGAFAPYLSK